VTTFGGLLPNTQFYFNGGTYTSGGTVMLDPGQSLQSRSADYSQPATGAARSTITNISLNLQGNNIVENMILFPPRLNSDGVTISGANNVIVDSQIGGSTSSTLQAAIGVNDSGTNTLISNSTILAKGDAYQGNGSTAIIENSVLQVNSDDLAIGLSLTSPGSNITVNNSQIIVDNVSSADTYAIQNTANSVVKVNNSTVIVNSPDANNTSKTYDVINNGMITVSGGNLSANSAGANVGIVDPAGSNPVTIQGGTVCQANGTTVVCP
jgi:hypothetical protein